MGTYTDDNSNNTFIADDDGELGFGVSDFSSFRYDNETGGLSFQGTQFATLENKPTNFAVSLDIQLI